MRNEGFVEGIITSFDNCDGVALDIGANHGLYTKYMATRFNMVYAFEPHPTNLEKLKKNMTPFTNIEIIPKAISTENGSMKLFVNAQNEGGHTIQKGLAETEKWGHSLNNTIDVECITLDTFCKDMTDIKLIKCDIEGGEYDIFYSAENTLIDNEFILILETHQVKDFESDQKERDRLFEFFNDMSLTCYGDDKKEVSKFNFDTHYLCTNMDLKWK